MKQTLTDAEIRERAPSVFAKRPAHQMSDRYQFVNTAAIVSMMRDSGYEVTRATQDSATRRDSAFVRHSITMRWSESDLVVGECIPQLLLTNAHNGCSSLRVTLGLYRVLCENGLLVAAESSVAIVRHSKSPVEDAVAWLKDSVLRLVGRANCALVDGYRAYGRAGEVLCCCGRETAIWPGQDEQLPCVQAA